VPITPAHVAAVLPVRHLLPRLPTSALVIGSCVPDFAYLVRDAGRPVHDLPSLVTFAVPLGLLFFVALEAVVLPALAQAAPRFFTPGRLPSTASGWALAAVGVLVGAALHLAWDGFTHDWLWPARATFAHVEVPFPGVPGPVPLTHALHVLFSALGVGATVVYLLRGALTAQPAGWVVGHCALLLVATAAGAGSACVAYSAFTWMQERLNFPWVLATGGWLGLLLASAVLRR
jgi:hypothetical protein